MKPLQLLLFLSLCQCIYAQRSVDVDKLEGSALAFFNTAGGEPIINVKFTKLVDGSPYFNEKWTKGSVVIDQREYKNLLLRVNLYDGSLEFQDNRGQQMTCTMPVKQVTLTDSITNSSHVFQSSAFLPHHPDLKAYNWLQLLTEGKAGLYKYFKKKLDESRPYGSATYEQRITTALNYYILYNDQWTRVKKLGDIPALLAGKKDELNKYIETNKLNQKDEQDMMRLIVYYNTL